MPEKTFADLLKEARRARGINQKQLVDLLPESHQSTVSSWETGKTKPGVADIQELAKALRCSSDFLLGLSPVLTGLPAGHWIVNEDEVEAIRAKRHAPDDRRWAWPVPSRFRILTPEDYDALADELVHLWRAARRRHATKNHA